MAKKKVRAKAGRTKAARKKRPVRLARKPQRKPAAKPATRPAARSARRPEAPAKKAVVLPAPPPVRPRVHVPVQPAKPPKKPVFGKNELKEYRQLLLDLRDRILDGISFLAGDNLNRSQREASGDLSSYSFHMADQGTDNFDREFALNLVSSEQEALYEINEALRRIDTGTFGICELTGQPIEKPRLRAMPFTRFCLKAQQEMERGKTKYRPFGPTITRVNPERERDRQS